MEGRWLWAVQRGDGGVEGGRVNVGKDRSGVTTNAINPQWWKLLVLW